MYEFIVLGLIPGTSIRISFGVWVCLAGMLFAWVTWRKLQRTRVLHAAIIALMLLRASYRVKL